MKRMVTMTAASLAVVSLLFATPSIGSAVAHASVVADTAVSETPYVDHVSISGDAHTKGTLVASYEYHDNTQAREGESAFRWVRSATVQGVYQQIPGAYDPELALTPDLDGAYVRVEVTPVGTDGIAGEPVRSAPIRVDHRGGNPNTDFLSGGYGISTNYFREWIDRAATTANEKIQPGESWDDILATFDVNAYVNDVRKSGASYVLLGLGQNSGYYLAPNKTYERIAGLKPGERTPSKRDLPMEIADALAPYGIKVMLYLPAQAPSRAHKTDGDYAITDAFGKSRETDGVPSQAMLGKWTSVIREWSKHYGTKIAGWWFDGMQSKSRPGFANTYLRYSYVSMASAAKAGNPHAVVSFNGGLGRGTVTEHPTEDFSAGETRTPTGLPANGRWSDAANGVQWAAYTPLGEDDPKWGGWASKGTRWDDATVASWVKDVTDRGGAVLLDTRVNRFGHFDADQMSQLSSVKKVVRDGQPLPASLVNDNDPAVVYAGAWSVSTRRAGSYDSDAHYTKTNGDSATFTFTGTGIEFIGERSADLGQVEIYIDGASAGTFDCSATSLSRMQTIFTKTGLTAGKHTIKIVKRTGNYALVDAFKVLTD